MKCVKNVKNLALVLILLTGFGVSNVFGQENESVTLYAVMFYADDCIDSESMVPVVKDLQDKLKDKKVEFIKFDFSDVASKEKTHNLANKFEINEILVSNRGTGFIVLADAKSKKLKATLTTEQSLDEMLAVILKNL